MSRPKRKYEEEVNSAEQTFEQMRSIDAELLGLADEVDAAFYGQSRVPQSLNIPNVEPGPVKVYRMVDGEKVLVGERPMTVEERTAWENSERGDE